MTEDLLWQNCGFRWRDNKIPGHLRRKGLHMCTRPSGDIANYLGVSRATLYRYLAEENAA